LTSDAAARAAEILWSNWQRGTQIPELPADCRPRDRAEGYAVQAEVARASGQDAVGWKIAATSVAGQRHIGVDGPLAGRLLSERVLQPGATIPLNGIAMRVAEAEFAFQMAESLPSRSRPYTLDEVVTAIGSIHPALEIPDSRYDDFVRAGAPQLIADTACACWVIIGPPAAIDWRSADLAGHAVTAHRNGLEVERGSGTNVLGDPRQALTWIANELMTYADGLRRGDVIITGTCVKPVALAPGDALRMDFGALGAIEAAFSA
jgi:2-keto-4-pentenoate hydratase